MCTTVLYNLSYYQHLISVLELINCLSFVCGIHSHQSFP